MKNVEKELSPKQDAERDYVLVHVSRIADEVSVPL